MFPREVYIASGGLDETIFYGPEDADGMPNLQELPEGNQSISLLPTTVCGSTTTAERKTP